MSKNRNNQGSILLLIIFLVFFAALGAIAYYFLRANPQADPNLRFLKNENLKIELTYPYQTDYGILVPNEYSNRIDFSILGKNYFTVLSQATNEEVQAWWNELPGNETKKFVSVGKPVFVRGVRGVELTFKVGSQWENQKEIILAKNGRNYVFTFPHGNCKACSEKSLEEQIFNSVNFY